MFNFNGVTMDATDLQQRVEQFQRDAARPVLGPIGTFRQKLKDATQRRLVGYHRIQATSRTATGEEFATKVVKATQRLTAARNTTVKQWREQQERERARWRKPGRMPPPPDRN